MTQSMTIGRDDAVIEILTLAVSGHQLSMDIWLLCERAAEVYSYRASEI